MPVPQQNSIFVEQARCLFLKKIQSFMNRQDACSTTKFNLCGTGILPVAENCAKYEFNASCQKTWLAPGMQTSTHPSSEYRSTQFPQPQRANFFQFLSEFDPQLVQCDRVR